MHEALPKSDPAYGSVQDIDGRLYVGGAGPEARKAMEREEMKARQRAEQEQRAREEVARRERLEAELAPLLEPWPRVRAELDRRAVEARERLVAAIEESPVFSAFADVLAAERAAWLGARDVAGARSSIDGRPRAQTPVAYSELLSVVREVGEGRAAGLLAEVRAAEAPEGG